MKSALEWSKIVTDNNINNRVNGALLKICTASATMTAPRRKFISLSQGVGETAKENTKYSEKFLACTPLLPGRTEGNWRPMEH